MCAVSSDSPGGGKMFSGHACVGTLFECARTQYCCTFVCMNMYTYNEIGIHLCSSICAHLYFCCLLFGAPEAVTRVLTRNNYCDDICRTMHVCGWVVFVLKNVSEHGVCRSSSPIRWQFNTHPQLHTIKLAKTAFRTCMTETFDKNILCVFLFVLIVKMFWQWI